jgi:hypothetical protein
MSFLFHASTYQEFFDKIKSNFGGDNKVNFSLVDDMHQRVLVEVDKVENTFVNGFHGVLEYLNEKFGTNFDVSATVLHDPQGVDVHIGSVEDIQKTFVEAPVEPVGATPKKIKPKSKGAAVESTTESPEA